MSGELAELERPVDEVPQGWTVQPLSKLCGEVAERVDPAAMNGDLGGHYIGLEHIGQGTGQLEGVGKAAHVVSQKSRFHAGDILYGKLRPNLRKVARPDFGGVCSTDIIVLRAKPSADPAFLFQVLQSEPLVAHAIATAAGTKMPRTHARSILSFEIASPPLDEQRRIAEVLRSVDEAISAQISALRQSKKTLKFLQGNLLDPNVNIEKWPEAKISAVARLFAGGTPKREKREYYEGKIPWLKSGEVRQNRIICTEESISEKALVETTTRMARAGTPVVAMYGATAGVVGMLEIDAAINQAVLAVEPIKGKATARFLVHALQQASTRMLLSQQGSGQPNLSKSLIGETKILLPGTAEQERIATLLDSAEEEVIRGASAIAASEDLKGHLMSDLLSGRVRVPA
ncbi:restriction endonuclease subunit S [Sandaracinobacteroides sp. A072]|uniref:restriction endonuclease subunit S n=1 Tax=Sandaracinobacteroides sp. A072 TaxID=3461146 RepID=UPI004042779D